MERWFLKLAPAAEITNQWSGQVIETPDGLPFIGDVGSNQYIATGFGGNGMTFGTLAALIVRWSNEAGGNAGAWACNAWHERTLDRLAAMINLACDETIPRPCLSAKNLCHATLL